MKNAEPVVALVVAAGSGVRMGSTVPKVLLPLAGEPALTHTVRSLADGGVDHVVVLTRDSDRPDVEQACLAAGLGPGRLTVAEGGARRQDTVARGLALIDADPGTAPAAVVLVHDGARPLVPAHVVARVIAEVRAGAPAVIPVVPVTDTVRRLADPADPGGGSSPVDRTQLVAVQTPQGFAPDVIRRAHDEVARRDAEVTDDAGACELIGVVPLLVPGSRESLKLTEPVDLVVAEAVLAGRAPVSDDAAMTTGGRR